MGLLSLIRRGRYERVGFELYGVAVAAARDPFLYIGLHVPDTLDGRFDMIGLYAFLLIQRLKREPAPGPALAQAVFDAMFSDMDVNLREMGVGDLSVGRKVRVMWEAFHGRAAAYAAAMNAGDMTALDAALERNVWRGNPPPDDMQVTQALRRLVLAQEAHLSAQNAGLSGPRHGPISSRSGGEPMTTELSRPIALSKIRAKHLTVVVQATPEECAAVAVRMDLPAIQSLECRFELTQADDGDSVLAEGHLLADVTQTCVTSAEDFAARVEEAFTIRFVPAGTERDDPDPGLPDEIPYEADTIDLGEATAEQLGLALDPWPRIEGASVPVIDDEDGASPFAILARRSVPDQSSH